MTNSWLYSLGCLWWLLPAEAATNNLADCAYATVNSAVSDAAEGDTLVFPVGAATWSSQLSIIGKSLTFIGAGTNQTVITAGSITKLIAVDTASTNTFRITGFTFNAGSSSESVLQFSGINISQSGFFRVDHCSITNLNVRGIATFEQRAGLIDHVYLKDTGGGNATGISPDAAQPEYTSNQWAFAQSHFIGTTNAIVVEDCVFSWGTVGNGWNDTYGGNWFVMRYCSGTNGNIGGHGTDSSGTLRGPTGAEIYMNTLYQNISGYTPFSFRGGSVQIWSNAVVLLAGASSGLNGIKIDQYRGTGINIYGPSICCSPWGPVSGTNIWDGNQTNGWPGLDQLGMCGPTTYNATNTVQTQAPCYFWGNTVDGTNNNTGIIGNDDANTGAQAYITRPSELIKLNRDWYEGTEKPDYTPLVYPHPVVTLQDGGGESPAGGGVANVGTFNKR